jgi:hypothetical protein
VTQPLEPVYKVVKNPTGFDKVCAFQFFNVLVPLARSLRYASDKYRINGVQGTFVHPSAINDLTKTSVPPAVGQCTLTSPDP